MEEKKIDRKDIPPYEFYEEEINLFELFLVLLKRRRLIIVTTVLFTFLAIIYSLLATPIYKAQATIIPPQKSGSSVSFIAQNLSNLGFSIPGIGRGTPPIIPILTSRRVLLQVIRRCDLMRYFHAKDEEDAISSFKKALDVTQDKKTNLISVSFSGKDPKLCAEVVNQTIKEADKVNNELCVTSARRKRIFLEKRLSEVKKKLKEAQDKLASFQKKHKAIVLSSQSEATVSAMAKLKAEIMAEETKLRILKMSYGESHPDVLSTKARIKELKNELEKLLEKSSGNPGASPFFEFSQIPDLAIRYANLKREVETQSMLFELLTKEYELAKIEEAKEPGNIEVLDWAVPPKKRISPKRKLIVTVAFVSSLFLSIFLAFFLEYVQKVPETDPESYKKFKEIKNEIKSDIKKLLTKR